MDWSDRFLEIQRLRVGDIAAHSRNPKRHPARQQDALRETLRTLGQADVLKAYYSERNDGRLTLYDGHARQGLDDDVTWPVAIFDLTDAEADDWLRYADPIASLAETDSAILDGLIRDASTDSPLLAELLSERGAAAGLFDGAGEAGDGGDDFDAEPADGPTRCQPGDLWVIGGKHRLVCGDCTDAATVARLMEGERANTIVTDPPYGVNKDVWDAAFPPLAFWRMLLDYTAENATVIVFPGVADLPPKLCMLGSVFTYQWPIVWYKPNAMQFGKTGFSVLDIAWWFSKGDAVYHPDPRRRDVIVDAIVPSENDFGHASPKQVGVMLELMDFVPPDSLILDPFAGSGTTLIAAHRTGRRAFLVEIEPKYCDVILRRAEAEGMTCERVEPTALPCSELGDHALSNSSKSPHG